MLLFLTKETVFFSVGLPPFFGNRIVGIPGIAINDQNAAFDFPRTPRVQIVSQFAFAFSLWLEERIGCLSKVEKPSLLGMPVGQCPFSANQQIAKLGIELFDLRRRSRRRIAPVCFGSVLEELLVFKGNAFEIGLDSLLLRFLKENN